MICADKVLPSTSTSVMGGWGSAPMPRDIPLAMPTIRLNKIEL